MELFDEFEVFVSILPDTTAVTSLNKIREKAQYITPLIINNDDSDQNFRKISAIVIQNLLNYHPDTDMFEMSSLKRLINTLRTDDIVNSDKKSQLMLLLHVTKMKVMSGTLCSWFRKIEHMKVMDIENDDRLSQWKTIASLTLKHPTIIGAITHLACECTGIFGTNSLPPIEVEFINCKIFGLRGFCGLNKVYINFAYIRGVMSIYSTSFHPTSSVGVSVAQMDISAIVIHELGHVILRQIINNPNICTPELFNQQSSSTINETVEFGRLSEMIFFSGQIDYWETAEANQSNTNYFSNFIEAIQSQLPLPLFEREHHFVRRNPSVNSGLDIDLDAEDIYI